MPLGTSVLLGTLHFAHLHPEKLIQRSLIGEIICLFQMAFICHSNLKTWLEGKTCQYRSLNSMLTWINPHIYIQHSFYYMIQWHYNEISYIAPDINIHNTNGCRFLTDANTRSTFPAVQRHPFFKSTNWETLKSKRGPLATTLTGLTDTSNFPTIQLNTHPNPTTLVAKDEGVAHTGDLAFIGYTYKRYETVKNMIWLFSSFSRVYSLV